MNILRSLSPIEIQLIVIPILSEKEKEESIKAHPLSKFKKIKGNMVISDTFSRFKDEELEAFAKDAYTKYDGTVIPRTKTWVTFS